MPVRGKTAHVRTNYGNDRLRAGVPDTGYILDCLGSLFFLRLHEVVDLIIQIFNQKEGLIPRSLLRNKLFQDMEEVIY